MRVSELDSHIAALMYTLHRGMGHGHDEAKRTAAEAVALLKREIGGARIYLARRADLAMVATTVRAMRADGQSIREIARALHLSKTAAWRLSRIGVETGQRSGAGCRVESRIATGGG